MNVSVRLSDRVRRAPRFLATSLLALVASCGVVPLPIGPSDPTAPPPLRAQDVEFRGLVDRWFGVWSKDPRQAAEAEALYAPQADALFFDGFVPVEGEFGAEGRSAERRRIVTAAFTRFEVEPREGVWLRKNGDRAIASVPFRVELESADGRAAETDAHATLVWEKRDGAWKIVHEHTSLALVEDWLGGIDAPASSPEADHLRAREPEFQRFVDDYLAAVDASRTSDAQRSNAPARWFDTTGDVIVWDPTSRRPLFGWAGVASHRDAVDLRVRLSNKVSRRDVRVWKSGDWAWATFTFTARATRRDGERFEVLGRQTNVFQKIDGAWKIVHEHASVPYGPGGTTAIPSVLARASDRARPGDGTDDRGRAVPASAPRDVVDAERSTLARLVFEHAEAWSSASGTPDWDRVSASCPTAGTTWIDDWMSAPATSRAELERAFPALRSLTVAPREDVRVEHRGSVAWATATLDVTWVTSDGVRRSAVREQSTVWERRGSRWWLVQAHTSTRP